MSSVRHLRRFKHGNEPKAAEQQGSQHARADPETVDHDGNNDRESHGPRKGSDGYEEAQF